MKTINLLVPFAALVLIVAAAPSYAAGQKQAPGSAASANHKKAKTSGRHGKGRGVASPRVVPNTGWGGWRPADPSFDQQGRLYKPPPGLPCPVDLGYGRWTSCYADR